MILAILVGAITGAITGAIVYLGGILWVVKDMGESMAMVDAIFFALVGAAIGFGSGVLGSVVFGMLGSVVLGKPLESSVRGKKNGVLIFSIVGGIVPTVFVAGGCSFISLLFMLM